MGSDPWGSMGGTRHHPMGRHTHPYSPHRGQSHSTTGEKRDGGWVDVSMVATCPPWSRGAAAEGPQGGTREGGTQGRGRTVGERGGMEGSRMMSFMDHECMSWCVPPPMWAVADGQRTAWKNDSRVPNFELSRIRNRTGAALMGSKERFGLLNFPELGPEYLREGKR